VPLKAAFGGQMAEIRVFARAKCAKAPKVALASLPRRAQHSLDTGQRPAALRFVRGTATRTKPHKWRRFVMQVRHILEDKGRDVVTIASNATLEEVARILSDNRIGALLVKGRTGALAGIISERDVVRAVADKGAAALNEAVDRHMTKAPQTCWESDSVESIMERMTRGRFRHLPVLDDGERLCGMVSIGDVVKIRIAETVREAAVLRDYISAAI
jgi:CBS domain-containing protein